MSTKRRITALFIMASIFFGCISSVFAVSLKASQNVNDEYYLNFLTKIGIADSALSLDDVVPRKDAALYASRLLGEKEFITDSYRRYFDIDGTENYAYAVEVLSNMGILSGDGDGRFHPNRPVTGYEAVKIIVEILGYRYLAKEMGGFPDGYLFVANKLKILKGVSSGDGYITGGDFVHLIYNSLEADIAEVTGVQANGDTYNQTITVTDGVTIMSDRLNLYRESGVVKSYYPISISSAAAGEGQVIIGDDIIETDEDISELLGCSVEYVYHLEDDDTMTLVYIEPDDKCDVEVLIGRDQIELDGMRLSYYNEKDKKVTVSVSAVADILYNFEKVGYEKKYIESLPFAKIRLVDNGDDGVIDFISVETYNTLVVGGKSAGVHTLFDKADPTKKLSLNEDDYDKIVIINADNEEISFDEILVGSVVTYTASDNMIKCYISNETVSGKAESKSEGTYTEYSINGTSYKQSPLMDEKKSYIGYDVQAYLDYFGFLAYIDKKNETEQAFAYLLSVSKDDIEEDNYMLKLFIKEEGEGRTRVFDCANYIKINGKSTKEKDFPQNLSQGVVAYKLNEEGEINTLETVVEKSAFEEGRLYCGLEGTSVFFYQANQSFGGKMLYNNSTVLFQISASSSGTEPITGDDIRIRSVDSLATDSYFSVKLYSTSNDGFADVVLLYSPDTDSIPNDGENFFTVAEVKYTIDKDDNSSYIIEGYVTGKEKTFEVHEDYLDNILAMDLKPGDVLRYSMRGAAGKLALAERLYRVDGGWQMTNPYPSGKKIGDVPYIVHGKIIGTDASYIYYTFAEDYDSYSGMLSDCFTYPKYRWSTITVIETGGRKPVVRSGTMNDIEPGDEIINYVWKLHPEGFTVIKNNN